MRRSRAPSIAPDTFFVAQSWADCITNMAGFSLRQAQLAIVVRKPGPAGPLGPENDQLMSERSILSLKPALRLERRGQHRQNKANQRDHVANSADSIIQ